MFYFLAFVLTVFLSRSSMRWSGRARVSWPWMCLNTITWVGFGTFKVDKRKARTGRNPQTGEKIKIKAKKVPKFVAGKALKDAVN